MQNFLDQFGDHYFYLFHKLIMNLTKYAANLIVEAEHLATRILVLSSNFFVLFFKDEFIEFGILIPPCKEVVSIGAFFFQ